MAKWLVAAALAVGIAWGQPTPGTPVVFGAPPGGVGSACTSPQVAYMNTTTGCLATCASSTWSCTGGGGGAGLFYRGDWDSATAYSAQDVVSYGGSSYVGVAASTGTTPGTDSTKWLIFAQQGQVGPPGATGAPGTPGSNGNGLLDGGGVAWTGNLVFLVSAASYVIAGTNYTSAQTSVTLAAADPSNPRIDVIAVDSTGTVIKITGTAAASPAAPTVDPSTQLELTHVLVSAGATTPSNIASTLLYDENAGSPTEWNATKSGAGLNLASTNNPFHGTIDVEATALATGNFVQLQIGSGSVDLSTQNVLVFYIRSKAAWNSKRTLNIQWQNAGTLKGQAIVFREGSFGFASANTTAYQQIVIPTAQWQTAGQAVTQLVFTVSGSGGSPGFYLDYIQLQSGLIQQPTTPGMVWRGAWSSTTSYNVNDVVTNANLTWVATASSTNSTPVVGTTWALVPSPSSVVPSATTVNYYIATTGSDSNPCSSASKCLTLAHVLAILPTVLAQPYIVNVADGTYAEGMNFAGFLTTMQGSLKILGNTGTPANVVFSGTVTCTVPDVTGPYTVDACVPAGNFTLSGVKFTGSGGTRGIFGFGSMLTLNAVTVASNTTFSSVQISGHGYLGITGALTITTFQSGALGLYANQSSYIGQYGSSAVTITGPGGNNTSTGLLLRDLSTYDMHEGTGDTLTISAVQNGITGIGGAVFLNTISTASPAVSVTNSSTPTASQGIYMSTMSIYSSNPGAATVDHFTTCLITDGGSLISQKSATLTNCGTQANPAANCANVVGNGTICTF